MKSCMYRISFALTVLVLLGLAVPGSAQQPPALDLVPFKITAMATTDRIAIPGNPATHAVRASVSGQSDLLGSVAIVVAHRTQVGVDGLPISTTDGVAVINTANGDAIFYTYSGLVRPPNPPGVFAFNHAFNITGGTGKFTGATGSGTATGVLDISRQQATYNMVGMITRPKP